MSEPPVLTPEQEARVREIVRAELSPPLTEQQRTERRRILREKNGWSLDRLVERLVKLGVVVIRPGIEE